jgi:uncharacterized protein (TIRG00374 family)
MTAYTRVRLLFGLRILTWVALGACLVWFARRLNWPEVFAAFEGVDLGLAVAATCLAVLPILLQGLRWSSLVREVSDVPRGLPVAALAVGQAASAILPLRAGEAVRMELLARKADLPRATAIGTVAMDHGVNWLAMFAFAALLPLLLPVPKWMAVSIWAGTAGTLLVLAVMWRLAKKPPKLREGRLSRLLERVTHGLSAAHNPRAVAGAFLFAALGWAAEIGVAMLALAAFHFASDLPHGMVVLVGVNLALVIPSPPAALGNFELGAGAALVAFDADPSRAAAFALGLHAIQLLPVLLLGGVMLWQLRKRRRWGEGRRYA